MVATTWWPTSASSPTGPRPSSHVSPRRWAVAAGHTRLAVMYATTPEDAAEARAFVSEAGRRNAQIVAQLPFDAGTTTFSDPIERLSNRELQVLNLIGRGKTTREIADNLNLSVKTVESHRQRIKKKLNLHTAPQLVQFAVNWYSGHH